MSEPSEWAMERALRLMGSARPSSVFVRSVARSHDAAWNAAIDACVSAARDAPMPDEPHKGPMRARESDRRRVIDEILALKRGGA